MSTEKLAYRGAAPSFVIGRAVWPGILMASLVLFLLLGAYQLELPGLQYDEAKEAGLNAMQVVAGQPVTAFRDATLQAGPWQLPLMVQDYIGALNVVLAIPFLALGGINVAALRWLPLLTAAVTLWLAWRLARRLGGPVAATATVLLLACNPTFVFWSRQGIFVTNITVLLFLASLLAALAWWQHRQPAALWALAFCWGLGIYAKLLFVWAIGAMVLLGLGLWLAAGRSRAIAGPPRLEAAGGDPARDSRKSRLPALAVWLIALLCFLLPLIPLVWFNIQTSGTVTALFSNLGRSYYGVDNRAYLPNLGVRLDQLRILLEGDHLWYLGEVYANRWAVWLGSGLVILAVLLGAARRRPAGPFLLPVALLVLIVLQSAFTVSDLFVTHYALLLPLVSLAGGLAFAQIWEGARGLRLQPLLVGFAAVAVLGWAGGDLLNTLRYHRILADSGGYGSHSDAIYRLADYLVQYEPSAPLALDWGMDAQLRFLTRGRVNPIEVFGYSLLDRPDPGFAGRLAPFLANPNMLYIAHVPGETVFRGRVEALAKQAAARGLELRQVAHFDLRSGKPLFVVYRVVQP